MKERTQYPDFDRLNLRKPSNFELLYDWYAPKLWRHILLRTSHREETDDILAKTFLKIWEYLGARHRIRNIRGFLYKTADHLIIDFYRARASHAVRFADFSEVMDKIAVIPSLDEKIAASREFESAIAAMRRLSDDDRRLITLRFVDDLPLGEVAGVIEKSKGATAVAIHRAMERLREALNEDESQETKEA